MSKVDRAPEPTLEEILSTIRQFSADIGQAERDQVLAFDTGDSVKPLSDATAIEKAITTLKDVLLPTSQPEQDPVAAPTIETAPERSPNASGGSSPADTVSWSRELARGRSRTERSRPKRRPRRPREFQAAGNDSSDASAVSSMSDIRLQDAVDAVRPLLRRWLNENMAKVFANALRDEFTGTGMPLWKARRQRNRWRRWFRDSH